MTGLMIAFSFTLPYHVMRAAAAAGLRVHVLGGGAARGLQMSRCCAAFCHSRSAGDAEALLAEITAFMRRYHIDIVFPGDAAATRLLATLRGRLPVRSTALPDLATFDLLDDKWEFACFCRANGVRTPQSWLLDSATELHRALRDGDITLPITIKPTDRSGGAGVFHIRGPAEIGQIDRVDYQPILVQRHIRGETVSITALCDRGQVVAHVAQQRDARQFRVFANSDLLAEIVHIVTLTGYDGVANFDAVLSADDSRPYLVECNPRFWYSIYLVMIAGLNFVRLAVASPAASASPLSIGDGRFRLSLRRILARPWRATRLEWKYLAYCLSDPIPFALQRARSYDDGEAAAPAGARRHERIAPPLPRLALG